MDGSERLRLRCASRDVFQVLAPFERKGFVITGLHARDGEATIELRTDSSEAMRAAERLMVPAVRALLRPGASVVVGVPAPAAAPRCLADILTIVLTTSAAPIHPSTEIVDQVLSSLSHHAPALLPCRMIITCDGCSDVREGQKLKYRSGIVDAAARAAYNEYVDTLRESAAGGGRHGFAFELLELRRRHGFGGAVRAALSLITTPLVLVVQHDRTLLRPAAYLEELAWHVLGSDGAVGYALLPTSKHVDYVDRERMLLGMRGVHGADADLGALSRPLGSCGSSVRLLPCLAWHDSTHVASVPFYKELFAREKNTLGFIESALGPRQAADAIDLGLPAYLHKWRTWVVDDGVGAAAVGHLDGSAVRPTLEALTLQYGETAGRRWRPDPVPVPDSTG